ncbi:unnamed protein product [Symbiodinium microadriaticum]|nr:unnamed protein product [Symbiodinium microadriaticum]
MRVKVRRVIAKRKWDAEYNETLSQLRGEDGLMMIKCRHNGTSAADKTFRLIDRQLIWNTGLFSKMKLGIGLHSTTQVVKGGHTFKTPAGRQSVAFQMKDNPFAKADRESSSERGSQVTMEDLHRRAITIANPPQQEIIVVCHSTNKRDHLVAVLERFCQELDLPTPPPANGDADNGEM